MRARPVLWLAPFWGVWLLVVGTARAEPEFPRRIQSTLSLDYAPPCSICHQYGKTGNGTPIEPFAYSMRARGLSGDDSTLVPALTSDEADKVDSDGDGIPDTVELKNGTDPDSVANDCIIPGGTRVDEEQCTPGVQASPGLGCTAGGARSGTEGPLWIVALGLLVALRRRRVRS